MHTDIYYNAPHRDFSKTDEALRIRSLDNANESVVKLTYKGPKIDNDSKTREEFEIKIDDSNNAETIFKKLGFKPSDRLIKTRKTYRLKDIYISLDDVKWLGKFMEIEVIVEKEDFESEKKRVFEMLDSFGFKKGDVIRESYFEMLKAIRKA